jgi:hypothetical protein
VCGACLRVGGFASAAMTASRRVVFRLAAAGAGAASLYHALALSVPAFAAMAYPPTYPVWRHVVFILIDGSLALLLLRPPAWLVWPYSLLMLQVLNGHGRSALGQWRSSGAIAWIDTVTVIGVAAGLALLIVDLRDRRRESRSLHVSAAP